MLEASTIWRSKGLSSPIEEYP